MNIAFFYGYNYGFYDMHKVLKDILNIQTHSLSYKAYNQYVLLLFRTYKTINIKFIVFSMKIRVFKIIVNYDYY